MDTTILDNMRILLVEDDIVNQMLFQRSFFKLKTKITIAGDAKKAIEFLRREIFDLIVMDIYLPDMDGCQTAGIIRNDLHVNTPVIAITASPIDEEIKRCIAAGMNGYIRKPFTLEQLLEIILKLVPPVEKPGDNNLIGDDTVVVDLNFLITVADNDREYIELVIKTFTENMPQTIDKMLQFYNDFDRDNLAKTAHFAKSSLSVIQIPKMFRQALLIEQNTKKTQLPDENIKAAIDEFQLQFIHAKEILNNYVALV